MAGRVGANLLSSFAPLLQTDLSMQRVQRCHTLVMDTLRETHPGYELYTFGSCVVLGYHEQDSDVDFVVLTNDDVVHGKDPDSTGQLAKSVQTATLGKLANALQKKHFDWKVEEVRRARVPLARIFSKDLKFDITAHRRNGIRNSALLRAYFEQEPMLRLLAMAVKRWSKRTGMNGSFGFLTSYGFTIMVIYYALHSAIAAEALRSLSSSSVTSVGTFSGMHFCDPDKFDVSTISPLPAYMPIQIPEDEEALGRLVLGFCDFYLDEFDCTKDVITLSREEATTKEQLQWTEAKEGMKAIVNENVSYRLCIEDPYEIDLNVGRKVTAFKLETLRKHLALAKENGLVI